MSVSSSYLLETSDCVPVFFGWHVDEWTNRLQKPLLNVAGIIGNLSICVLSVALGHLTMKWICFALIFPSMHFCIQRFYTLVTERQREQMQTKYARFFQRI